MKQGHTFLQVEYGTAIPHPFSAEQQLLMVMILPTKLIGHCKNYVVQASFVPGREALMDFSMFKREKTWKFILKNSVNSIAGDSVKEIYRNIQQVTGGLERECLPLCVGGTYDFDVYHEWYRQRMQVEFSQIPLPTPITSKSYARPIIHSHDTDEGKQLQKRTHPNRPKMILQWVDYRKPKSLQELKFL